MRLPEFGGAATAADTVARGRALLLITQHPAFQARELNRSFVQMQYFGYLRRNPNDAPDGNFNGYDFWLNKLKAADGNSLLPKWSRHSSTRSNTGDVLDHESVRLKEPVAAFGRPSRWWPGGDAV